MEERVITIVDSATNTKYQVTTSATTFGELKVDAAAAGVNYEGKDWLEGITKTTPVNDSDLLPTDVNWRGTTTNNLVYMLTNTNKKIKSGANLFTRAEVIQAIKANHLEYAVKTKFGKNYTNCSTDDLRSVINAPSPSTRTAPASVPASPATPSDSDRSLKAIIIRHLLALKEELPADIVKQVFEGNTAASKSTLPKTTNVEFSDDDIDAMFD
jgi:hypothetical protein